MKNFLRQKFCRHEWRHYYFFVYLPDVTPKTSISDIKIGWFYEAKQYLESIGGEGLLPFFCKECEKCGKQTPATIDTLIKGTIAFYLPAWED